MATEEGKLAKGLRFNSAVFTNSTNPAPSAVRRAHSYHLYTNPGEHRTSEDLRQTALRNGLTRVNSASKVDTTNLANRSSYMAPKNKNIPMVAAPPIGRLGENRWGTYSLNQPINNVLVPERKEGFCDSKVMQKSSISPLTQIHQSTVDNAEIVNPGFEDTSHSKFKDSYSNRSSRGSSRSSLREFIAHERIVSRLPDKKGGHSSMFSLVPTGRSDTEVDVSEDETTHMAVKKKRDEFDENYEYNYEDAFLQHPDLASATSVLDFMKKEPANGSTNRSSHRALEIPDMSKGTGRHTTRTNQKILDMRMLLSRQEESTVPNSQHSGIDNFGYSSEHAVKIQHESIASQWTQIRLRFSSKAETVKGRTNVTCRAGILGSIDRQKQTFSPRMAEKSDSLLTRENVGAFLHDLWHEPGFQTQPTQLHYAPEVQREEECEDEPMHLSNQPNISSMAQNAMMTRV